MKTKSGETLTLPAQNIQPFNLTINAGEELTSPDGTTITAIKQRNQPVLSNTLREDSQFKGIAKL